MGIKQSMCILRMLNSNSNDKKESVGSGGRGVRKMRTTDNQGSKLERENEREDIEYSRLTTSFYKTNGPFWNVYFTHSL